MGFGTGYTLLQGHTITSDVAPEPFNDGGGQGCRKFVPVLGGYGTKIASFGDIFNQPRGKKSSIRASLPTM